MTEQTTTFEPGQKAVCHFTDELVLVVAVVPGAVCPGTNYLIQYGDGDQQIAHETTLNVYGGKHDV